MKSVGFVRESDFPEAEIRQILMVDNITQTGSTVAAADGKTAGTLFIKRSKYFDLLSVRGYVQVIPGLIVGSGGLGRA